VKAGMVNGGTATNLIVFTGGGKLKTTAALGLACRAAGDGGKAVFIHFSGPVRFGLGDVQSTKVLGPKVRMIAIESQAADVSYVEEFDESVATVEAAMFRARELLVGGECSLLVLDDINPLLRQGVVDEAAVMDLVAMKPESATIVLTGRSAPQWAVEMADIVTDFVEVRHPRGTGMLARKGIEF